MTLTSAAKRLLAETIRGTAQDPEKGLRARLLRAIHDEADRRYRLSVPIADAGLDEAHKKRRERIEAWMDEQARAGKPKNKAELAARRLDALAEAEKQAAATFVNRLVLLRRLEALGLSKPPVLTGGWNSKGYREFRAFAPALTATNGTSDGSEGYATLLKLIFDELALDLPGLFGDVGLTSLFAVPPAALRDAVETLDDPELGSAWTDDTTLGWVYQYWNDPDREALDAKINSKKKIAPHEIASKTQMFTERYMVEWLLQNSLGLTWLAMCKRDSFTPDADRVLPVLDARRAEWRKRREAGEVALDALMPIEGELEERWKYYVPQPIPEGMVNDAPERVSAIKVLDPACGSGHFLVIAFDLLAAMYREEARHLGTPITDRAIAESIVENNLFGIDIDPRAVQIAAAALYLKARSLANDARPARVNLVAPVLKLGRLPSDDPTIVRLCADLKREAGIQEGLTQKLLETLKDVDHLGSLLKVDAAVDSSLRLADAAINIMSQGDLFSGFPQASAERPKAGTTRATVLNKLEAFLESHARSEDLGLRLGGEQIAAGVRFVRMIQEGTYDVVVGNPPYQGLSKTEALGYVTKTYPLGKADLYAAFLQRALELAKPGGLSALLTMRSWMFLKQYEALRKELLHEFDLRALVDLDSGAFDEVSAAQVVLSVVCSIFRRGEPRLNANVIRPTPTEDRSSTGMTDRKRAGLLAQVGRYEFDPHEFVVIEGEPIVYWWSKEFLERYKEAPKLGEISPARFGANTGDNTRFLRKAFEGVFINVRDSRKSWDVEPDADWVPFIKGAAGKQWLEPVAEVIRWRTRGLELKISVQYHYGNIAWKISNESFYFRRGIAFTMIGNSFAARAHRFPSIIGDKGSSVYPEDVPRALCVMNRWETRMVLQGLNPTVSFQVGDVNRLPIFPVSGADHIFERIESAFSQHEAAREPSVEFCRPGPSAWRYAQDWAQRAVDRPEGAPLPPYEPVYDPPTPLDFVSFAVGVALGRFGAGGEGILDQAPSSALPSGILFVSAERGDSVDHPACGALLDAHKEHGEALGKGDDVRAYLRKSFFDAHKKRYENKPIYFPIASAKKSFVALVSIHRWRDDTLQVLLADHLMPAKRRLEGELGDLRAARASSADKTKLERRFAEVQKLLEELSDLINKTIEVAEQGPPPTDDKTPKREVDARFHMDLDDGVMVNSAALWPLLAPCWKDPAKWWRELASAQSDKDYDWSHVSARYFPTRVRQKCHEDPSLAVAHQCFWELHPAKAYAWELRLQDEIRPDFTIDEPLSDASRERFLREQKHEAKKIRAKERKRRKKKHGSAMLPLFAPKAAEGTSQDDLDELDEDDELDDEDDREDEDQAPDDEDQPEEQDDG